MTPVAPNASTCSSPTATTKQRSAIPAPAYEAKIGTQGLQLPLTGEGFDDFLPKAIQPSRSARSRARNPQPLLQIFRERLARRYSPATARQYAWVLGDLIRLASRHAGHPLSVIDLLHHSELLGRALASGERGASEELVSAWLASQRRSVVRAFARLMRAELAAASIPDGEQLITDALRQVATPVGTGYQLPVGWVRRRGGTVASGAQTEGILRHMGNAAGWKGSRNRAFLLILSQRGQRVGALLQLDGASAYRLPNGETRLLLRAKSSRTPAELTLPVTAAQALDQYIHGFNAWALVRGLTVRIGFGVAGPIWRTHTGGAWSYEGWRAELASATTATGAPGLTAHSFRRGFATEAVTVVPRALAALAGNWTSTRRMDDHYVHPDPRRIGRLVGHLGAESDEEIRAPSTRVLAVEPV